MLNMRKTCLLYELIHAGHAPDEYVKQLYEEGLPTGNYAIAVIETPKGVQDIESIWADVRQAAGDFEFHSLMMHGWPVLACFPIKKNKPCARGLQAALNSFSAAGRLARYIVLQDDELSRFGVLCLRGVEELKRKIYFENPCVDLSASESDEADLVKRDSMIAFLDRKSHELSCMNDADMPHFLIRSVIHTISRWQKEDIYLVQVTVTVFAAMFISQMIGPGKRIDDLRLDRIAMRLHGIGNVVNLAESVCGLYDQCRQQRGQMRQYPLLIQRFYRHVKMHSCENLSLVDVAQKLSVNSNYLSGLIKKETGESFTCILNRERLETAKKFLADPQYNIESISSMVGYHSYISFYKAFKRYAGKSPKEYRKELLL